MSKHTPGPWEWQVVPEFGNGESLMSPSGPVLSNVEYEGMFFGRGDGKDNEVNEANRRLIKAAPRLLKALQDLVPFARNACVIEPGVGDALKQADEAIAEATLPEVPR